MTERLNRFYTNYFGQMSPNSAGECSVNCCFHNDSMASMSVNVRNGLWHCFRCASADDIEGGDEYDFYREYMKRIESTELRFGQVKAAVDAMVGPRTAEDTAERQGHREEVNNPTAPVRYIDEGKIEQWHMLLFRNPRVLSYLLNRRGIKQETIDRFRLGWDIERMTIPIKDSTALPYPSS